MSEKTKKALAQALEKLLHSSPIDKITVKAVTDACGVNRQTFYYHFKDIYDLAGWMFDERLGKYFAAPSEEKDLHRELQRVITAFTRERRLVLNVCRALERTTLERGLQRWMQPAITAHIREMTQSVNISEENRRFIAESYGFVLCGVVMDWIDKGMKPVEKDITEKFVLLLEGTVRAAVEVFAEK